MSASGSNDTTCGGEIGAVLREHPRRLDAGHDVGVRDHDARRVDEPRAGDRPGARRRRALDPYDARLDRQHGRGDRLVGRRRGSIGAIDSWLNGANTTGKPPRSSSCVNRPNSAGPVSGRTRSTPVSTEESRTSEPSTGRPELAIATPAAQAKTRRYVTAVTAPADASIRRPGCQVISWRSRRPASAPRIWPTPAMSRTTITATAAVEKTRGASSSSNGASRSPAHAPSTNPTSERDRRDEAVPEAGQRAGDGGQHQHDVERVHAPVVRLIAARPSRGDLGGGAVAHRQRDHVRRQLLDAIGGPTAARNRRGGAPG